MNIIGKKFIVALQSDKIQDFIDELNNLLLKNHKDADAWLYLARSFETLEEIEKARNAYVNFLRFSEDCNEQIREIVSFKEKHKVNIDISNGINRTEIERDISVRDNKYSENDNETSSILNTINNQIYTEKENNRGQPVKTVDTSQGNIFQTDIIFNGTVKFFSDIRGYGYIISDNNEEYFVHFSDIMMVGYKSLFAGDKVTFQVVRTPKGMKAVNVKPFDIVQKQSNTIPAIAPADNPLLSKFKYVTNMDPVYANTQLQSEYKKYPCDIKLILNYISVLQRLREQQSALKVINESLPRFKSSSDKEKLLLPKAQILTSMELNIDAMQTYAELIRHTERNSTKHAHFLDQLARLQLKSSMLEEALSSAQQALKIIPDALLTRNLLVQIERYINLKESGEEFTIDIGDEQIDSISPMLKIDIEEYDYRDEEILKHGSMPSINDAERLERKLEGEKAAIPERYPQYLELAKAYQDLPLGSYDTALLQRSLARYAFLRGVDIYNKFISTIKNSSFDQHQLQIMKDSAGSYFIEALNLQVGEEKQFLETLSHYLKIKLLYEMTVKNVDIVKLLSLKSVADILRYCIQLKDNGIYKILLKGIVASGAANLSIWNEFTKAKDGFEFFKNFRYERQRVQMYNIIKEIENHDFDISLRPGLFFKSVFDRRRQMANALFEESYKLQNVFFSPETIKAIINKWQEVSAYETLFSDTDRALYRSIFNMLKQFEPYLSRTSEERTNILYKIRTFMDETIRYIEDNTTYWGRTIYYPNLKKWRKQVDEIEKNRLKQTLPHLKIVLDPPFFKITNKLCELQLLVKNIGAATAESATLEYQLLSIDEGCLLKVGVENINSEINAKGEVIHVLDFQESELQQKNAATIQLSIAPIYEGKKLESSDYSFTVERESLSSLSDIDIPWDETKIPSKELFKGRDRVLSVLLNHLSSSNRNKTYILWGLTRTGKSSILTYLSEMIDFIQIAPDSQVRFICFIWDLSKAAAQTKASDMWGKLIIDNCFRKISDFIEKGTIESNLLPIAKGDVRFKDWERLIRHLNVHNFYPVFLVDEFSYYKQLVDQKRIDSAFLASIRSFAIDGLASFIFAGTYDLKDLIKDPDYGITGQLVNTIEMPISQIDKHAATDLINVMNDRLQFTDAAIVKILMLSNQIPYFIQILCKNCGYYAVETRKRVIGAPEVEYITKMLTGEERKASNSLIGPLSPGVFMNNQYSPQDQKEISVLISTIAHLNKGSISPRGIRYEELLTLWGQKKITAFSQKLADSIERLKSKGILIEEDDEGSFVYKIGVDLFRRWWAVEHGNIELQFASLREE